MSYIVVDIEIRHDDGSFASCQAAQYTLKCVREEDAETGERQLTIPDVSNNEERVTVCPTCDNPFPHLYENKGGHCEECKTKWAN